MNTTHKHDTRWWVVGKPDTAYVVREFDGTPAVVPVVGLEPGDAPVDWLAVETRDVETILTSASEIVRARARTGVRLDPRLVLFVHQWGQLTQAARQSLSEVMLYARQANAAVVLVSEGERS